MLYLLYTPFYENKNANYIIAKIVRKVKKFLLEIEFILQKYE